MMKKKVDCCFILPFFPFSLQKYVQYKLIELNIVLFYYNVVWVTKYKQVSILQWSKAITLHNFPFTLSA